jgi:hypothetical protein
MRFSGVDNKVLIIYDYHFYGDHQEEIDEWCWQTFGYHPREGMVMTFRSEQDVTWFLSRWA